MSNSIQRWLFPSDLHHVAGLHEAIQRALPEQGRILDLGCGSNLELVRYRTDSREIWGCDIQAHPHLHNPEWFRALRKDGTIPFPDHYFDAVVTVMVLEHVDDPKLFFAEIARVLRPGGHFIGHSISGIHYVTFIRRLFGLLPHRVNQAIVRTLYQRPEVDTFPAYYQLNTSVTLLANCQEVGLRNLAIQRYADSGYFRFAWPLQVLAILTDRLLESVGSGLGRLYFTLVAHKPVATRQESRRSERSKELTQSNRRSSSVR